MVGPQDANATDAPEDRISHPSWPQLPSKDIQSSSLGSRQSRSIWDHPPNCQLEPRVRVSTPSKRKFEAHHPGFLLSPDPGPTTSWRSANKNASAVTDCNISRVLLSPQRVLTAAASDSELYPGQYIGHYLSKCQRASSCGGSIPVTKQSSNKAQSSNILYQSESRPISSEELAIEVKNIYSDLVAVEAKCITVDKTKLASNCSEPHEHEKWRKSMESHRKLLSEHHDFLSASQHPSTKTPLARLARKYSIPARMWKHSIHSFLEVIRRRLLESRDYMLHFIYTAYQMMATLYGTVNFENTTYRERTTKVDVARSWYSMPSYMDPQIGRLYHHLGILARPNLVRQVQQVRYYARSLTCVEPFLDAQRSLTMTLDMFRSQTAFLWDCSNQALRTPHQSKYGLFNARVKVLNHIEHESGQSHFDFVTGNALSNVVSSILESYLIFRFIAAKLKAAINIYGTRALLFLSFIHAFPGVMAASHDEEKGQSRVSEPYYLALFGGLCLCALLCLFAEALGKGAARIARVLGPLLIPTTALHCVALVVAANKANDLPLSLPIVIGMSWLVLASLTLKIERRKFEPDQHALFTFWVLIITAGLLYASSSMMTTNTIHSSVASCFTLAIYLVAQLLPRPRGLPL